MFHGAWRPMLVTVRCTPRVQEPVEVPASAPIPIGHRAEDPFDDGDLVQETASAPVLAAPPAPPAPAPPDAAAAPRAPDPAAPPLPMAEPEPTDLADALDVLRAALRDVENIPAVVPASLAAPEPVAAAPPAAPPPAAPPTPPPHATRAEAANDDGLFPGFNLADSIAEDPPMRPARSDWRHRARRFGFSLGAVAASLLLAVAGYETTRLMIGLPDLLGEAHRAVASLLAGPERPIVAAARRGNAAEVEQLLKGGFAADSEDPQGVPALLIAARNGHDDVVQKLLAAGADPNRRFASGETPLIAATREGLLSAVDAMLARGGQVNGRGGPDECETPLLAAAGGGRIEMVNFLLARGATFDVLPGCKRGPLDAAAPFPRVRDALEQAYQRRLAGASPRPIPAAVEMPAPPAPPTPRVLPAPTPAPAPAPQQRSMAEPPAVDRGYAALMYGMSWRDTLAEVKAQARECRSVGKRYEVCVLDPGKTLFEDAGPVEAWFDRADGDRFVSIETRSQDLIDYTPQRDGATARHRFDQVRREVDKLLAPGPKPIVQRNAATGMTFFEGLKPEVGAADFSAFWSDEGRRRPATVHLKLSGIDNRRGFWRIVVANPLRQSQQAAASPR